MLIQGFGNYSLVQGYGSGGWIPAARHTASDKGLGPGNYVESGLASGIVAFVSWVS